MQANKSARSHSLAHAVFPLGKIHAKERVSEGLQMTSVLASAHLFPKLCTCTASVISMPLCIKAASWQAVHHLVGSLAELL